MTIIKSEFYRLSSQVSRLWGHRQESMAGSGWEVSGLCRETERVSKVRGKRTGAAKSRLSQHSKQSEKQRDSQTRDAGPKNHGIWEWNVKKYVKILDTNRTDGMTMQVCSGEWLLICLVLVKAWEKRGEKKGKPSRREKPFSLPSSVCPLWP